MLRDHNFIAGTSTLIRFVFRVYHPLPKTNRSINATRNPHTVGGFYNWFWKFYDCPRSTPSFWGWRVHASGFFPLWRQRTFTFTWGQSNQINTNYKLKLAKSGTQEMLRTATVTDACPTCTAATISVIRICPHVSLNNVASWEDFTNDFENSMIVHGASPLPLWRQRTFTFTWGQPS